MFRQELFSGFKAASVAVALLIVAGPISSIAKGVTLPFVEDFTGTAPDFTFAPADKWTVGGGVATFDSEPLVPSLPGVGAAPVQVTSDLSNIDIVVSTTLSASTFDGNSDLGLALFGTNGSWDFIAAGSGHYLADFKSDGSMRILKFSDVPDFTEIATAPAGTFSFSADVTYTLTVEATRFDGELDLKFTVVHPTNGPVSIAGTDFSPLTGQFFGLRTRPDANFGGTKLVADYHEFSIAALGAAQPGDFDGDGDVDGADFVVWQTNFPKASGGTLDTGDADGDGDVDGADFVVWQTNFPFTPSSSVATVPEPLSLSLMIAAAGAILMCCRRRPL